MKIFNFAHPAERSTSPHALIIPTLFTWHSLQISLCMNKRTNRMYASIGIGFLLQFETGQSRQFAVPRFAYKLTICHQRTDTKKLFARSTQAIHMYVFMCRQSGNLPINIQQHIYIYIYIEIHIIN
jgi:hypothetical protein